ncbi:MAG: hypothetical protein KBD48_03320 [Candidatus Pacebacteria bacterium]|nr:hypothetical protein [Candidatus Paceibacterota bacterium]MBP9716191.1 hypothetical protein [Candidatus Paceibacterota bacterium]
MNIQPKELGFTAPAEDRLSFLVKFATGENFIVKKPGFTFDLKISAICKEDGGGKRFLFEAYMVNAVHEGKGATPMNNLYKGYFDSVTLSGYLMPIPVSGWIH